MKYSTIPMVFRSGTADVRGGVAIADNHMISASVCRQAVSQYIKNTKADAAAEFSQKTW